LSERREWKAAKAVLKARTEVATPRMASKQVKIAVAGTADGAVAIVITVVVVVIEVGLQIGMSRKEAVGTFEARMEKPEAAAGVGAA
jgi:hypothetical protein